MSCSMGGECEQLTGESEYLTGGECEQLTGGECEQLTGGE